jgi:hypothetical protein
VDAYTKFPDCCCLCLRPHPGGSREVRNGQVKYLGDGRYETTSVSVRVPVCSSCNWSIRMRQVATAVGALGFAGLTFAWWYADTKGSTVYLIGGAILALIVGGIAGLVLGWLFQTPTHRSIAYLEVDGSDITFANPEYQALYTGESRPGGRPGKDWGEVNWR